MILRTSSYANALLGYYDSYSGRHCASPTIDIIKFVNTEWFFQRRLEGERAICRFSWVSTVLSRSTSSMTRENTHFVVFPGGTA